MNPEQEQLRREDLRRATVANAALESAREGRHFQPMRVLTDEQLLRSRGWYRWGGDDAWLQVDNDGDVVSTADALRAVRS